jgi:retron-type reverse transcriptase
MKDCLICQSFQKLDALKTLLVEQGHNKTGDFYQLQTIVEIKKFSMNQTESQSKKPIYRKNPLVTSELNQASGPILPRINNKLNVLKNIRTRVEVSIKRQEPIPIFTNLYSLISSKEILTLAYAKIKSNSGSMTPGTISQTADEFSTERIEKLHSQLKTNTYTFPDTRRIWIPKPGKNINWKKKENLTKFGRPLGMPDFDTKVVQASIVLILESIYEPIFQHTNVSFGFRPKLSCQDAIYSIPEKTQAMHLAIEGDIKGAFDNLNHNKLIQILSQRINDKKFLKLILQGCQTGIFDAIKNTKQDSLVGVPQGSIASPIIWNIYMHEFDKFILQDIQELISTLNKRQKRYPVNKGITPNAPFYRALLYQKHKREDNINKILTIAKGLSKLNEDQRANVLSLKKEVRKINLQLLKTPSKTLAKQPLRIFYRRYADDWILFLNGKTTLAQLIKNKCTAFLKDYLYLTLSNEKTKITNLQKEKAKFLGFTLKSIKNKKITVVKGTLKRTTGQKLIIGYDKERILARLMWKGFLDTKGHPKEKPAWSILSDYEIIERYNSIIRGTINYYAPIINYRSTLNHLVYLYEYSCYKTLCQKHRTTIKKILRKYRNPLKISETINYKERTVTLLTTKHYWKSLSPTVELIKKNLHNNLFRNEQLLINSNFLDQAKVYWRTKFKLQGRCIICGSNEKVEMHHIKAVRGYNAQSKKGFSTIMALLNRKQIPVCKHHHILIHKGLYDGVSPTELFDTRIGQPENFIYLN